MKRFGDDWVTDESVICCFERFDCIAATGSAAMDAVWGGSLPPPRPAPPPPPPHGPARGIERGAFRLNLGRLAARPGGGDAGWRAEEALPARCARKASWTEVGLCCDPMSEP
jgi:hypothetical protein